jgi:CubicO group peptidase (beta-lactamase class C family)
VLVGNGFTRCSATLLLVGLAACAGAETMEFGPSSIRDGDPAAVGMSAAELADIAPAMRQLIAEGRTGGIMTLVARDGIIVHWQAHGWRVVGEEALERNDIFRIYSMTKPIVTTAAMMLVEEGALRLDQPLSEIIPSFSDVQVQDDGYLRPPRRPLTIHDLMRHTSGLTYGIFGNHPVDVIYRERINPLARDIGMNTREAADAIAAMPLLADPGTRWNYSVSIDVLGAVVEVVSGMPLDDFLQTRIFEPLRMVDTGFEVEASKLHRLLGVYEVQNGALTMTDSPVDGPSTRPPSWFSGGGGLMSTPMDYLRFAQMILNEGELDGVRILQPETVAEMRRNQLPAHAATTARGGDEGFGLGFAVVVEGDREGLLYWSGVANTWFWIDPVEDIIGFAWTQSAYRNPQINPLMRELVYEAIAESRGAVPAGAN